MSFATVRARAHNVLFARLGVAAHVVRADIEPIPCRVVIDRAAVDGGGLAYRGTVLHFLMVEVQPLANDRVVLVETSEAFVLDAWIFGDDDEVRWVTLPGPVSP